MHRVGLIPFDFRDDLVAILFVTSQTRGRWVLPKGRVEDGETHADTCHREGFEEAGVKGVVLEDFPITVPITKLTSEGTTSVPVTYYPFLVQEQFDAWPEDDKRQRHWALLDDAPQVAYREDFHDLIARVVDLMPWIKESAKPHKQAPRAEPMPAR